MSLERISTLLRASAGLEVDALGKRHLGEAVSRLRAERGLGVDAYAELVATDAGACECLVGELLVHETSFFRYPASFRHLAAFVVALAAARPGPVRILSAACATGQEPYSVAIALLEAGLPPARVCVAAFDRSASAIERARAGRFDGGGLRGLDAVLSARWFEPVEGALSVLPPVRALVTFETGSLLDDDRPFAGERFDVVLCRNVLIYLTTPARRRALASIRAALAPDGIVYLGHAEVLVARAEGFVPLGGSAAYACLAGPATAAPAPAAARAAAGPVPGPRTHVAIAPAAAVPREQGALADARDLADAGRLEEATAVLEAELSRGRPLADHLHLLALVRRAGGLAREADEALGRALYLDPSHVGALLLSAVAARGRGELVAAARFDARARAAFEGQP